MILRLTVKNTNLRMIFRIKNHVFQGEIFSYFCLNSIFLFYTWENTFL